MRAQIRVSFEDLFGGASPVFTGQYLSSVRQDLSCTIARVTIWARKWKRGLLYRASVGGWKAGRSSLASGLVERIYRNFRCGLVALVGRFSRTSACSLTLARCFTTESCAGLCVVASPLVAFS